jgi:hypothetical protein
VPGSGPRVGGSGGGDSEETPVLGLQDGSTVNDRTADKTKMAEGRMR